MKALPRAGLKLDIFGIKIIKNISDRYKCVGYNNRKKVLKIISSYYRSGPTVHQPSGPKVLKRGDTAGGSSSQEVLFTSGPAAALQSKSILAATTISSIRGKRAQKFALVVFVFRGTRLIGRCYKKLENNNRTIVKSIGVTGPVHAVASRMLGV